MRSSRIKKYLIVLSELAELDLTDILQYTLEKWGEVQMDNYAAKLEHGLRMLETQPHLGKPRDDWYQGCRCYSVERHSVLYELVAQEIRIARIFNQRFDLPRHL